MECKTTDTKNYNSPNTEKQNILDIRFFKNFICDDRLEKIINSTIKNREIRQNSPLISNKNSSKSTKSNIIKSPINSKQKNLRARRVNSTFHEPAKYTKNQILNFHDFSLISEKSINKNSVFFVIKYWIKYRFLKIMKIQKLLVKKYKI